MKNSIILIVVVAIFCACGTKKKDTKQQNINTFEYVESPVPQENAEQMETDTSVAQNQETTEEEFQSSTKLDSAQAESGDFDSSQVSVIDTICAISVTPDESWMDQHKKDMGDGWDEVTSDQQYYEYLASQKLEKNNIFVTHLLRKKRYIKFVKFDNSNVVLDFDKMKDAWGMILFNRKDNPVLWNSTDIDKELKEIFNK